MYVQQSLPMSMDLYCNGKNSFYSNLTTVLNYYNCVITFNCNHDTLDDTKIKHIVGHMKKKHIVHWKHSLRNSQKLEFILSLNAVIHHRPIKI